MAILNNITPFLLNLAPGISIISYRLIPIIILSALFTVRFQTMKDLLRALPLGIIMVNIWVLLSCLWSPNPVHSFLKSMAILGINILGWKIIVEEPQRILRSTLFQAAFLGAIIFLTEEFLTQGFLYKRIQEIIQGLPFFSYKFLNLSNYNRAITVLAIFFWPLYGALQKPFTRAVSFFLVLGLFVLSNSETSSVAFICGGIGYLIIRNYKMVLLLKAGILLSLIGEPLLPSILKVLGIFDWDKIPFSLKHRFFIWEHFQTEIWQKPWLGWGMDAAHIFSKEQLFSRSHLEISALHPHNSLLQIWYETGAIGALIFGVFFYQLFAFLKEVPFSKARIVYAQIITTFVISLSAFGLWQTWWVCSLWIGAYLTKVYILTPYKKPIKRVL